MKKLLLSLLVAILFAPFAHAQEWEYLPNTDDFEITGTFDFKGQHYVYNEFSLWYFDEAKEEWIYSFDGFLNENPFYGIYNVLHGDEKIIIQSFDRFYSSTDGINWSPQVKGNLIKNNEYIRIIGYLNNHIIGVNVEGTNRENLVVYKSSDLAKTFTKVGAFEYDTEYFADFPLLSYDNDHLLFTESLSNGFMFKINSDFSSEKIALPDYGQWHYIEDVHALKGRILLPSYGSFEGSIEYFNGNSWTSYELLDTVNKLIPLHGFFVENEIYVFSKSYRPEKKRVSKYDLNFNLIEYHDLPDNIDIENILSLKKDKDDFILMSKNKHHLKTKDFESFQFFTKKLSTSSNLELVSQGMDLFINNSDGVFRTSNGSTFKKLVPDSSSHPSDYKDDVLFAIGKNKLLYYSGPFDDYFISIDNGDNWTKHNLKGKNIENHHEETRFYQANNRYFFFYDGFDERFFRLDVETREVNITNLDFSVYPSYSIRFFGEQETIFCSIFNDLYKSIDGGKNWFKEKETGKTLIQLSKRLFKVVIDGTDSKIYEWKNYNFNEIKAENTYEILKENPSRNFVEYKSGLAYISRNGMYYLENGSSRWEKQTYPGFKRDFSINTVVPTRFGLAVANKYRGSWFLKEQVVNVISNEIECLTVYPNPNKGRGTIDVPSGIQGQLEIMNIKGQSVFSKQIEEGENHFNIKNPVSGVYFIRLLDESGVMKFNGKLILEK
ncbi:MAG: hypothetical protein ACJATA_000814 [Sphingobacteriales bacterium]|jgi:hypothetical protein